MRLFHIFIIPLGLYLGFAGWAQPQGPSEFKKTRGECEELLDSSISSYRIWPELIQLSASETKIFMQILLDSKSRKEKFDAHISAAIFDYVIRGKEPLDLYSDESFLREVRLAYKLVVSRAP